MAVNEIRRNTKWRAGAGARIGAARILSAGLVALLLLGGVAQFGCMRSLYGVAYRSADRLAMSRIDDYLDLTGDQETLVRKRLRRIHAWHRKRELPAYARSLRRAAELIADGLTESELKWIYGRVRRFRDRIYYRTTGDVVRTLLTLNEAQINHLGKKLAESNEELEATVKLPRNRRLAKRVEKSIEYTEDWVGDLSGAQKSRLRRMVAGLPDLSALRLRYRRERQAQFLALLRSKPSEKDLREWLRTRVAYNQERLLPDYYRGPLRRSRRAYRRFTLQLDGMLTREQRAHARTRMLELADDMESWAK